MDDKLDRFMLNYNPDMKKYKIYTICITIFFLSFLLISNIYLKSLHNYATTENILEDYPNSDIFVIGKKIYINSEDMPFSKGATLKARKLLGKISNTGVYEDFKNWNSTKLEIGKPI